MVEHTSMRNGTRYGFQEGDRTFFSNMPEEFLRAWRDRLSTSPKVQSHFDRNKDLAIVGLEQQHLDHIVDELVLDSLGQNERRKVPSNHDHYSHHTADSFVDVWEFSGLPLYGERVLTPQVMDAVMSNGPVKLVYGRTKFRDSVAEKLARLNACWGFVGFIGNPDFNYHVVSRDATALTVVGKDEEACRNLKEEIDASPHVQPLGKEKDYFTDPKDSGYTALHQYYAWMSNTIPTGTVFEIHFETLDAHPLNLHGNGDQSRAHKFHSDRKYKLPHDQGDNQILVIEKDIHDPGELKVTPVDNGFAQYLLID